MALFSDPTFWVAAAAVLFFGYVGWKAWPKIIGAIDKRIEKISSELEEARKLREQAQAILDDFREKQQDAEQEAKTIQKKVKTEVETLRAKAEKDLEELLARREQAAKAKIKQAELSARQAVREEAASMAVEAVERLLKKELDVAKDRELVRKALDELPSRLN